MTTGRAIVLSDGAPPHVHGRRSSRASPFTSSGIRALPEPVSARPKTSRPICIATPRRRDKARSSASSTFPPKGRDGPVLTRKRRKRLFAQVGLAENAEHTIPGRHPLMHRTASVDYGIVLEGEIVLLLDDEEVALKAGDVVVQRGSIHAWTNRTRQHYSHAVCANRRDYRSRPRARPIRTRRASQSRSQSVNAVEAPNYGAAIPDRYRSEASGSILLALNIFD